MISFRRSLRRRRLLSCKCIKKTQMQEKELRETTMTSEKLRSSLKNDKKRFLQMVVQRQAAVDPLTDLISQLQTLSASLESLRDDMQKLRIEKAVMEKECDRIRLTHHFLSEHHKEMMSKKTDIIPENQATIVKLECMVDELVACQSEDKTRQVELEDSLKLEKTRSSELWKRANQTVFALKKERTTSKKFRDEL